MTWLNWRGRARGRKDVGNGREVRHSVSSMIPISKIETLEQLIGTHTEEMCREGHYIECANCFIGPFFEFDGAVKPLVIPKPVVPSYRIVAEEEVPGAQLSLGL